MKLKFLLPGLLAALMTITTSCDSDDDLNPSQIPAEVTASFTQRFPTVKKADWETEGRYYVADFNHNTFDCEAWFLSNGQWAMTETDYDSLVTMLPMSVQTAFNQSQYASWIVDDVKMYEKPIASFCVIEVETSGIPEIALFYDTYGNLLNRVQGFDFDITPDTEPSTLTF